jgi:hypothetical protein
LRPGQFGEQQSADLKAATEDVGQCASHGSRFAVHSKRSGPLEPGEAAPGRVKAHQHVTANVDKRLWPKVHELTTGESPSPG